MYTIYIMERRLILLGLVIIVILALLCSKGAPLNEYFPSNFVDPNWKNMRFFKKTLDNQLLATAPVHILEQFEENGKKKAIGQNLNNFLSNKHSVIKNTENTQSDLNSSLSTQQLLDQNKQKLDDLSQLTDKVQKRTKHASTIPKLNAKFQKQGPILPERKGFEYQLMKEGKCRFFSGDTCPDSHPLSTGANIGISGVNGINLSCNGVANVVKGNAVATINEYGQIDKVHIVNRGKGYKGTPSIHVVGGGGYGGKCDAVVDENGSVQYIDIISAGDGYTSSPKIELADPNGSNNCMLCCQPDLFN